MSSEARRGGALRHDHQVPGGFRRALPAEGATRPRRAERDVCWLVALALVCALAAPAAAATATELAVADAVRARLPAELGLVSVELPATTPAEGPVAVEWRGAALRPGKVSVMVTVGGRRFWARVKLAPAAPSPAPRPAAIPPAVTVDALVPRGAPVKVLVRRGPIEISAEGQLELATRIGEPATVRLATGARLVHGTLAAAGLVLIGDAP